MLDALTLDQLRVFIAIVDTGSFRGAASQLRRVQSAVSFAVANLEEQLAVPLFDRTTRTPTLTAAGQALLQDARSLVLKAQALRARGQGLARGLEITVTLAVESLLPPGVVAAAAAKLLETYPSIALTIVSSPLGGPLELIATSKADLAVLLSDELRDPAIELEAIGSVGFHAVAAPSHPLATLKPGKTAGKAIPTSQLAEHLQIVVPDPTSRSGRRGFGVLSPRQWAATDIAMKVALIEAGVGWGHLPDHLAVPRMEAGTLAAIRPADTGPGGRSSVLAFVARRHDTALGPGALLLREELTRTARAGSRRLASK